MTTDHEVGGSTPLGRAIGNGMAFAIPFVFRMRKISTKSIKRWQYENYWSFGWNELGIY